MSRFPGREADIKELAQNIIDGISENSDFPSPPVSSSDLRNLLDAFVGRSEAQIMAKSAAEQATESKQTALVELISAMKSILHYAEDAVHGNDAKLSALGWSGRASREALLPPGQPGNLDVPEQDEDSVRLVWERPSEGGAIACYNVERREKTESGSWTLADTSVEAEITLVSQERGKMWEYRVIAVNRAGKSRPSNTVVVVL